MARSTTRSRAGRLSRAQRNLATPAESPLALALRRICADLKASGARYALVGGLAVSARAEPRLTRDVDVAVAVADDAEAEHLVFALQARGYTVRSSVEQTRNRRLATVRLIPPVEGGTVVDLLFSTCGIEPEIVDQAEQLSILPGLVVPVARVEHLIVMKLLSRDDRTRPQDLDDIRALLVVARARERKRVPDAITLVTERKFSRRRNLTAAWNAFLRPPVRDQPERRKKRAR